MAATDLVTLADAKAQLNITDNVSDAELAGYISAVTGPVEQYTGAVVARSVTEVFDPRNPILLSSIPVLSVTSVTDNGTTVDPAGYRIDINSGILTRVAGPTPMPWLPGVQSVSVTYLAGLCADTASVPPHVRLAALLIVQHMWETQRPAAQGPFSQAQDDFDPRYAYSIPRRALELLGDPVGGFA